MEKFKTGDLVRIKSKTSRWDGAYGEIVGYCNGRCPEIVRVRISNKKVINLKEESLELVRKDTTTPKGIEREELKKKLLALMQQGTEQDACSNFARSVLDSVKTDDEPLDKIGYYLLKAFLEDDVSDAMIALCGWSMESLMIMSGMLPDDEGLFFDKEAV